MTRDEATRAHWQLVQAGELPQFVIYHSPSDYPGKYVVRMWRTIMQMGPTNFVGIADTLDEARDIVPLGLFRMARFEQDDPVIVETWF